MCQLSIHCCRFAAQSLDYLVDMFNDEIEGVRLKAISSLCQISSSLELREDQLETVLAILEVCVGGKGGGRCGKPCILLATQPAKKKVAQLYRSTLQ